MFKRKTKKKESEINFGLLHKPKEVYKFTDVRPGDSWAGDLVTEVEHCWPDKKIITVLDGYGNKRQYSEDGVPVDAFTINTAVDFYKGITVDINGNRPDEDYEYRSKYYNCVRCGAPSQVGECKYCGGYHV